MSSLACNPGGPSGAPGPPSLESLMELLKQLTASGLLAHAAKPIPFEAFRAELLALYKPPMRSPGSWYAMRKALEILEGLGVQSTADFTDDLIARFVTERHEAGEHPNGTHALLARIRAAVNYAAAKKYVQASPFANRRRWVRKVSPAKAPVWHSREAIAKVLSRAQEDVARKRNHCQAGPWAEWRAHRLYALAATVAYTGVRKMEALCLRVEDLMFEERIILIQSRRDHGTKTEASAQPVPMPAPLVEILRGWAPHLAIPKDFRVRSSFQPRANPRGKPDPGWVFPNAGRSGPWLGGSPGRQPLHCLVNLGLRAGVREFTFQSLRHSWATNAEYWGLSEVQIQRMLRHTNTRTQSYYRHAEASNLRAMIQGIGFGHELQSQEAAAERIASNPAPASHAPPLPLASTTEVSQADPRACGPKLTLETAAELRKLREEGWSYARLMKRYGISKSTVHYAVRGATWKGPGGLQEPAS
jgi:integrase